MHTRRDVMRRPGAAFGAAVGLYLLAYVLPGTGPRLADVAPIAIVLVGVVFGTVTALGAVALILTYRANRFVNFAFGTMGSVCGINAIGLHRVHGMPFLLALVLAVVAGALVGALVDLAVLRRFREAPRLVLTVASIGLAQLLGGIELGISKAIGFVSLGAGFTVPLGLELDLGIKTLRGDELLIVLVAPAVLAALTWFLVRTETGVAVRAAAENHDRALLLGIPVRRNTTVVWMLAGGLATLTFVLKAPFSGVQPGVASTGPAILLPALAAAVVARMESLSVALGAGIGLGILEQVVRWNSTGTPSVLSVVMLAVILVALLVQRDALRRSAGGGSSWSATGLVRPIPAAVRRLPEVRIGAAVVVTLVAVLAVAVPAGWSASSQLQASFALVWAMVGVSLVVLTGWGGNVSLGQFGLVGVGAMVAGNLIARTDLDLLFVTLLATVAGGLVALAIGLPALRIGSLLLAVTTIAFAAALDEFFLNRVNFPTLVPSDVPRSLLFNRFDLEGGYAMYLVCLAVLGLCIAGVAGLRSTRTGRNLLASRDNDLAAAAAGVVVPRVKLTGFVLAGAIAGLAGSLHVQLLHSLNPGTYPVADSVTVFSTAVIGGLGSPAGAVLGVLLFKGLEAVTALGALRLALTGFGLLVVLYALPGGLGQALAALRDRVLEVVARRRGIDLRPPAAAGSAGTTAAARARPRIDLWTPATAAAPTEALPLLRCRDLSIGYGHLTVVPGLDLDVERGEILALLGTNGAGKSTLLRGICGLLEPRAGSVLLDGEELAGLPADVVARRGVSLVPGGAGVFPSLTVAENLRMAAWLAPDAGPVEEAYEVFPVLRERLAQRAGDLSGGEQQMLALASALLVRPELLLVDELSLGLAPTVVHRLLDVVRSIHAAGTTVVLVEQSVSTALEIAERAVFLERGELRFEGRTADLLHRPDLLRSVFIEGGSTSRAPTAPPVATTGPALRCAGMVKRYGGITAVDEVGFEVAPGEVLGLIGHNGAGKTTLLDCLSGATRADGGSVEIDGTEASGLPPAARALLGLGRSFQNARLYPSLTVREAVAVARERHVTSRSAFADLLRQPASYESELAVAARVDDIVERLGLGAFADTLTGELSTGTRRIVDIACMLAGEPSVLLLDEPSSGVAQKETEALAQLLLSVRDELGCAVVVIEHDMPMLRTIADRLVALELGAVIAQGRPDDVLAHPKVVESYLGVAAAAGVP